MPQEAMIKLSAKSLLILFFVDVSSTALGDETPIQADVYDALYQAYVQCDEKFSQKRSEFITEKLEGSSGEISITSLRKTLNYDVQRANQSIAQKTKERELHISEILGAQDKLSDQPVSPAESDTDPHEEARKIDEFLKEQRQYVEVHVCVIETL